MLNSENTFETTCYHNGLCIFYRKILPYNPIVGSYDGTHHVIIWDLDLIDFNLNIIYSKPLWFLWVAKSALIQLNRSVEKLTLQVFWPLH